MAFNKKNIVNNLEILLIMTICIIISMIIVSIIFIKPDIGNKKSNLKFNIQNRKTIDFPVDGKVYLYFSNKDETKELDLEEYIVGVVAAEMPANFDEEAIKAQAVAARTFYINRRNNPCRNAAKHNAEICDTVDCQVYMSKEERIAKWNSSNAEEYWNKISNAVSKTKGQVMTYNGEVLEYPQYFAISHGKTEESEDVMSMNVPYLKSVDSIGEEDAPKYKSCIQINTNEFINRINNNFPNAKLNESNLKESINIKKYTKSGSVNVIQLGTVSIKGTEFRKLFNLNSTCFTLDIRDGIVSMSCTGYGHGLGMSQWGANYMAKNNYSYEEILKHYYTGIEITNLNITK